MIDALILDVLPRYRDVMTTGGYVLASLIAGVTAIQVARINAVGRKVDKTIEQTEHTSNGFAKEMRERLDRIERSQLRGNEQREDRDNYVDKVFVKFDDRLLSIEEKLS